MAKNKVNIDPETEFSWIGEIHSSSQINLSWDINFFLETNNVITASNCILTDLLHVFSVQVLNFLMVFDIINLFLFQKICGTNFQVII